MAFWLNCKLTKQQVYNMPCWQNGKLTKCHIYKMASWQNGILIKLQVNKTASLQNATFTKWLVDKASGQNEKRATWQKVKAPLINASICSDKFLHCKMMAPMTSVRTTLLRSTIITKLFNLGARLSDQPDISSNHEIILSTMLEDFFVTDCRSKLECLSFASFL